MTADEKRALVATLREVHEVCVGCLQSVVSPRSLVESWRRRVEAVETAIELAQRMEASR